MIKSIGGTLRLLTDTGLEFQIAIPNFNVSIEMSELPEKAGERICRALEPLATESKSGKIAHTEPKDAISAKSPRKEPAKRRKVPEGKIDIPRKSGLLAS